MKHRYVRSGEDLEDDEEQLVRGGRLNPETIRVDALRMHDIYGIFGISVFSLRATTVDELAQQNPLVRFSELSLVSVGQLRTIGLILLATGRNRRHYTVCFPDLDSGVKALCTCEHQVWDNPYNEP